MISPRGVLYLANYGGHSDLCWELCLHHSKASRLLRERLNLYEDVLIELGWLTVRGDFIAYNRERKLPKAQLDWLKKIHAERPSFYIKDTLEDHGQ